MTTITDPGERVAPHGDPLATAEGVCHLAYVGSGETGFCGATIDCHEISETTRTCPGCDRRVCPECLRLERA